MLTLAVPRYSDQEVNVLFAYYLKRKGFVNTLKEFIKEAPEIAKAEKERGGGAASAAEAMHTQFCLVRLHDQLADQLKSPGRQTPCKRADAAPGGQPVALQLPSPGAMRRRAGNGDGAEKAASLPPRGADAAGSGDIGDSRADGSDAAAASAAAAEAAPAADAGVKVASGANGARPPFFG